MNYFSLEFMIVSRETVIYCSYQLRNLPELYLCTGLQQTLLDKLGCTVVGDLQNN